MLTSMQWSAGVGSCNEGISRIPFLADAHCRSRTGALSRRQSSRTGCVAATVAFNRRNRPGSVYSRGIIALNPQMVVLPHNCRAAMLSTSIAQQLGNSRSLQRHLAVSCRALQPVDSLRYSGDSVWRTPPLLIGAQSVSRISALPARAGRPAQAASISQGYEEALEPEEEGILQSWPRQGPRRGPRPDSQAELVDSNPTGMQITFLGTGNTSLTPGRHGTAISLRLKTDSLLFEVPEDTQRRLLSVSHVKPGRLNRVFVSGLGPDQISGLPGMMCTISAAREAGNEAADVPIHLYGPPGLASFLEAAMELSDTYLLVPVIVHEFVQHSVPGRDAEHQGEDWAPFADQIHRRARLYRVLLPPDQLNSRGHYDAGLSAMYDRHTRKRKTTGVDPRLGSLPLTLPSPGDPALEGEVSPASMSWTLACGDFMVVASLYPEAENPTFAYTFVESDRSGTFNVEVAAQLGVPPGRARGLLKDGTPVEIREGVVIYPDQVLGPMKPGRRLLLANSRSWLPPPEAAWQADILIGAADCVTGSRSPGLAPGLSHLVKDLEPGLVMLTHLSAGGSQDRGMVGGSGERPLVVDAEDLGVYMVSRKESDPR